jgi:hypothetical protein
VTRRSQRMQKQKFSVTCPDLHFLRSVLVPPEQEKGCVDVLSPRRTGMHYVTRRSRRMQKHKFGITCPEALFVKSVPLPPEHEKYCVDVSCRGRTGMHYVTCRSHRMQKQKIDVTCPTQFLWNLYWSQLSLKNIVSTIHSSDGKLKVRRNVSRCTFCQIHTGPTQT